MFILDNYFYTTTTTTNYCIFIFSSSSSKVGGPFTCNPCKMLIAFIICLINIAFLFHIIIFYHIILIIIIKNANTEF